MRIAEATIFKEELKALVAYTMRTNLPKTLDKLTNLYQMTPI